jgi:hypothetical protein
MNGPFSDYPWGDAYEVMRESMLRMSTKYPQPRYAQDDLLVHMWLDAWNKYNDVIAAYDSMDRFYAQTQDELEVVRGKIEDGSADDATHERFTVLVERLNNIEPDDSDRAAMDKRVKIHQDELELIDEEFARRPWMTKHHPYNSVA